MVAALVIGAGIWLVPKLMSSRTGAQEPFASTDVNPLAGQDKPVREDEEKRPYIPKSGPHPLIVVEQPLHDFGVMAVNTEQSHDFVIKNEGEADLVIVKGKTSCKCTLSEVASEPIPPGGEAAVTLSWRPTAAEESFTKTAQLYTNDPLQPELVLSLRGSVQAMATIEPPPDWTFGRVVSTQPAVVSGDIFTGVVDDFDILEATSDFPLLKIDVTEMDPDVVASRLGKVGYKVTCTLLPLTDENRELLGDRTVSVGPFSYDVTLRTNLPGSEQGVTFEKLQFKVNGVRLGPVELVPMRGVRWIEARQRLDLKTVPRNEEVVREMVVRVSQFGDTDLKVLGIEEDDPALEVEATEEESGLPDIRQFRLKFTLAKGRSGAARSIGNPVQVTVKTNHPDPVARDIEFQLTYLSN